MKKLFKISKRTLIFVTILCIGLAIDAPIIYFYSGAYSQNINNSIKIKNDYIDFSKPQKYKVIKGIIEVNGHQFLNDTCKCPILFKADLSGITIIDTCLNITYQHRNCSIKGCKIIHLMELQMIQENEWNHWKLTPFQTIPTQVMSDTVYFRNKPLMISH